MIITFGGLLWATYIMTQCIEIITYINQEAFNVRKYGIEKHNIKMINTVPQRINDFLLSFS